MRWRLLTIVLNGVAVVGCSASAPLVGLPSDSLSVSDGAEAADAADAANGDGSGDAGDGVCMGLMGHARPTTMSQLPQGECSWEGVTCTLYTQDLCPDGFFGPGKVWQCSCENRKWSCVITQMSKTVCTP
jgi:hypothetical protein